MPLGVLSVALFAGGELSLNKTLGQRRRPKRRLVWTMSCVAEIKLVACVEEESLPIQDHPVDWEVGHMSSLTASDCAFRSLA